MVYLYFLYIHIYVDYANLLRTELTLLAVAVPLQGLITFAVIKHAPQPPSRHMTLVPFRLATLRM